MIHKVRLENFKSYYGVKIIGPFHKCFTSVVGPNGSGKSNLIECMLFIFGHRAKKLWTSKLSDVIHSSVNYPNVEFAKVSVYFQEIIDYVDSDSYYETVEGSAFVIQRVVLKNNVNKYYIN